ncbi:polyketide synthase dehydratase domain-containing protein [Siccirubricoccus deserti]
MAGRRLDGRALVGLAASAGLGYGPAFQSVEQLVVDTATGAAQVWLRRPEAAPPDAGFLLHPARLDGAFQGLIGLLAETPAEAGTGLVPVRFDRLVFHRGAAPIATAAIRLTSRGERSAAADLVLRDAAGATVAIIESCRLGRIRLPGRDRAVDSAFRFALVPTLPGPGWEAPERIDIGAALTAARQRAAALDLGEAGLLLEGFCAAAAHAALSLAPATGPYARALLEDLAEDGLAVRGPLGLRPVPAPDLPPAVEIWQQVWLEQPGLAPDLAWLALAAERLPQLLTQWPVTEDNGQATAPPAAAAGLGRLATVLAEAAASIAASWPRSRPLRVLEVGAAPGPATARLAAVLAASGRRILYCAAALPGQPAPAAPREAAGLEYSAAVWDPQGQEPPPIVADLVIGLCAGARLRGGALLPAALRQVVAPAALLLVEPLPGRLWDFCCGQNPPGGSRRAAPRRCLGPRPGTLHWQRRAGRPRRSNGWTRRPGRRC